MDKEYEVWIGDEMVAGASGRGAQEEAMHYALVSYANELEKVTVYEVTRRKIYES